MRARKDADLAPNGADFLLLAAIRTDAAVNDLIADDFLGDVIQDRIHILCRIREVLRKMLRHLGLDLCRTGLALLAVERVKRPFNLVHCVFAHECNELGIGLIDVHFHLRLADFSGNAFDEGDDLLDGFMGKQDRLEHFRLGQLVCAGLNHHDRIARSGNGQAQAALFALGAVWIDDVFTVHIAHAHGASGAHEGCVADGKGDGRADHGKYFGLHIRFHGKDCGNHLNVVVKALGEQRAQRPVNEAACEDRTLGRAAFALDESTGDLAHGIHLFFKFHAQRKEIHTVTRRFCHRCAHEHRSIPAAHQRGSAGLFSIFTCFDGQRSSRQLH